MDLEGVEAALQPWRAACESRLREAVPGFAQKPRQEQLKLVLQQCLQCDLNLTGASSLPSGVQELHATQLAGRFFLQLDEVVNIGAPAKQRYQPGGGGHRCLKLLLTDGTQQVVGLEYQFCPALSPFVPAGTKVLVRDAPVRRGMLLLTPANLVVLGGSVEALEQARQRAVEHWNQPAVGRRGPPAQIHEVIQLATAAAWGGGSGAAATGAGVAGQPRPALPLAQQQQQQLPAGPQPVLAALRQPPAAQSLRQPLQLPPPPQVQLTGTVQRPVQQQQQQHPNLRGDTWEAGSVSLGSLPLRQRLQQQLAGSGTTGGVQNSVGGSQSFSFGGQENGSLLEGRHISLQGDGDSTSAAAQQRQGSSSMPLQPTNWEGSTAAAAAAKKSRLHLQRSAEPADFSFMQPGAPPLLQQQQQQPQQALHSLLVQPQGASGSGAAGTDDDPIVIDEDDSTPGGRAAMQLGAQQQQQQHQVAVEGADEDAANWSDDDWDAPPDDGPRLEPYEQGFDELEGSRAQGLDGGDGGGEPVGHEEEWQDDDDDWGCDAMEGQHEEEGVVAAEGMQLDTAAAEEGADADMQEAGDPPASNPAPPAAGWLAEAATVPLPTQEAAAQPSAAEPPAAPSLPHAAAAAAGGHEGPDLARRSSTARKRQVVESSDEDSEDTRMVGAPPPMQIAPQRSYAAPLQQQPAAGAAAGPGQGRAPGSVLTAPLPVLAAGDDLELAPLDDLLLRPPPSLIDLMSRPAAEPPPLPLHLPALPPTAYPGVAAAPIAAGGLRSGGQGPSRSGGGLLKVSTRPPGGLQLRPSLVSGAGSRALQPQSPAAPVAVPGSDDDVPVFHGLVDEDSTGTAGAAGNPEEEPFTYLHLLAQRAKSAAPGDYPLAATIFGLVKTMVGKLQYENPDTGASEYHVCMLIEDGSMVCNARLGHQFMLELFDRPPTQLKQQLTDPATKAEALQLVQTLQRFLGSYSGLMRVVLRAPGALLEVQDLAGGLTAAQAAALQCRAMS